MSQSSEFCNALYQLSRSHNAANVELELNGVPVLVIQRHEDADRVLRANASNYRKNMAWFRQALGASRFSEDGAAWEIRRALTQHYFTRFDRQQTFALATQYAHAAVARLAAASAAGAATIDDAVLREMSVSVLVRSFLGVEFAQTGIDLGNLAQLMECGSEYSFVPPGRTSALYRETLARLPDLRRRVLQDFKRFRAPGAADSALLADMLAIDRDPANDVVLEHELLTFFAAGAETTAATMGWACYLLARYPAVQQQLRESLLAATQRDADWETLQRLQPLQRFISETLRLYPPTPIIARFANGPDVIGGRSIPAGQNILVSFIGIQHDARQRPDPWQLDLGQGGAGPGGGTAFSFGPRVCGGKHFALVELAAFLAVFLTQARFTLTSEAPPRYHWKAQMLREGGQPVHVGRAAARPAVDAASRVAGTAQAPAP
ncbi:cytochrome P450 [Cupriavidus sp. MP-37]|uniref:cytochrome P450 n=1 Tax=Cupriavidus sp. MP-37 TaxID=2884455 RepID=UPI001D0B5B00|nr:cytochrome P450 [Cupriavidus sp. MP-37]UDM48874.1 cytochrome P450 [Cupriavidus sp. MP-37]